MNRLNTPTSIILFKDMNEVPFVVGFNANLRQRFGFEETTCRLAPDVAIHGSVQVSQGAVTGFSDPVVRQFTWKDPLEEQDIVLLTCDHSTLDLGRLRDLLNFACPANTHQVVTLASVANKQMEAGFRISVVCSAAEHLPGLAAVKPFAGKSLSGSPALLLGLANALDIAAYAIVIEHADSGCVSSSAIEAAMQAFSCLTEIDLHRGQLSDQAIRIHRHLKEAAAQKNADHRAQQSDDD